MRFRKFSNFFGCCTQLHLGHGPQPRRHVVLPVPGFAPAAQARRGLVQAEHLSADSTEGRFLGPGEAQAAQASQEVAGSQAIDHVLRKKKKKRVERGRYKQICIESSQPTLRCPNKKAETMCKMRYNKQGLKYPKYIPNMHKKKQKTSAT